MKKFSLRSDIWLVLWAGLFSLSLVMSQRITVNNDMFSKLGDAWFEPMDLSDGVRWLVLTLSFTIILLVLKQVCVILGEHFTSGGGRFSLKAYSLFFLILELGWLPAVLTFFPGGVFSDTDTAIKMATGAIRLHNHHPLLYTFAWKGAMTAAGGALQSAAEIFTIVQFVFLALAAAYFLDVCLKLGLNYGFIACVYLYFILYPPVADYVVSLWKDVPFALAVLLLSAFLMDALWKEDAIFNNSLLSIKGMLIYAVLSALVVFTRNNGLYCFALYGLALALYFLIRCGRRALGFLAVTLAMAAVFFIVQGPVYDRLGFNFDRNEESLSLPLQQSAYMINTDAAIADSDREIFYRILPEQKWKDSYLPFMTDPIKWDDDFDSGYFNSHIGEFLGAYLRTMAANPSSAFKSYYLSIEGYWDVTRQSEAGYVSVYHFPGIELDTHDIIKENTGVSLVKAYMPENKASSACYGFLMLLGAALCLSKGKKRHALILLPGLGVYLTVLIASPYAYSLRYIYPAVLLAPLSIAVMFANKKTEEVMKLSKKQS